MHYAHLHSMKTTWCPSSTCAKSTEHSHYLPAFNDVLDMQGCFFCFDCKVSQWTRSGKLVRNNEGGFRVRLDNHKKASLLKNHEDRESKFHLSYPSGRLGLKGTHEHLQPCTAFGCNPKKQNAVDEITTSSNYFDWSKASSYFQTLKTKNESVQSAKHVLVACLFECCYDLLLSKQHNVSNIPGYESITGQCGCKKNWFCYWIWCFV